MDWLLLVLESPTCCISKGWILSRSWQSFSLTLRKGLCPFPTTVSRSLGNCFAVFDLFFPPCLVIEGDKQRQRYFEAQFLLFFFFEIFIFQLSDIFRSKLFGETVYGCIDWWEPLLLFFRLLLLQEPPLGSKCIRLLPTGGIRTHWRHQSCMCSLIRFILPCH